MEKVANTDIEAGVKEFILSEFLPGEDPAALTNETPLLATNILDSIATLKMVAFLEERFQVKLEAHEVTVDNLATVAMIAQLVREKLRVSDKTGIGTLG